MRQPNWNGADEIMSEPIYEKGACAHCAGHIEFPATASGQAIPCPHCGQTTLLAAKLSPPRAKPARLNSLGIVLGGLALALAGLLAWRHAAVHEVTPKLAAANLSPPQSPPPAPALAPVVQPKPLALTNDFALMPYQLEPTPGSSLVYVTGLVRNLSSHRRFAVKLQFALSDTNDRPVGAATDYRPQLEPQAEWRFKAMVLANKAATAQFQWIAEDQ